MSYGKVIDEAIVTGLILFLCLGFLLGWAIPKGIMWLVHHVRFV